MPNKVLLIIPCYNEASRLDMEAFKRFSDKYVFLFVNDGSTDETSKVIHPYCNHRIHLHELKENSGKSEAVRQGFLQALQMPFANELEWLGFWDADLATPLEEVEKLFLFRTHFGPDAEVIIGSRVKRLGSTIQRKLMRHLLGRVFATVADSLFHLYCYDTQCGAKLFQKHLVPKFANEPFISRWAFDVELLVRIRQHKMLEYPLSTWQDVAGSKLKVGRVGFKIMMDFYRMNKKYSRHH